MLKNQVKSKVYITKKSNGLIIVSLGICVIITSIISILSIINDGLKVGNISPIIISLAVGITVLNNSKAKGEYLFDIASISIDEKLEITYQESKFIISFLLSDINSLQYSDQLKCLRFYGNYTRSQNNNTEKFINNEYLFYVGDGDEQVLINELERTTGLIVQYIDR